MKLTEDEKIVLNHYRNFLKTAKAAHEEMSALDFDDELFSAGVEFNDAVMNVVVDQLEDDSCAECARSNGPHHTGACTH